MRLQVNDSVVVIRDPAVLGIAEFLSGSKVRIRLPLQGNKREEFLRGEVRPLAESLAELRAQGTHLWNGLSLAGESTLADLVATFGYATQRLRQDSLEKVLRQLRRAGLDAISLTGGMSRDDRFRLDRVQGEPEDTPTVSVSPTPGMLLPVALPETFWPTAFGLSPHREIDFLHALMHSRPILCILQAPDDAATVPWLQAAWEGVLSWAFRSAQQFIRRSDYSLAEVQFGPASLLNTHLQTSVLDANIPQLLNRPHCLNLVTLRKDSELPVDFERLRAVWPGPVFRFDPELSGPSGVSDGHLSSDIQSILGCLLLAAGCPPNAGGDLCPLKTLLWSAEASARILTRATARLGKLLREKSPKHFKGSNEGSTALGLKADVAAWITRRQKEADLQFESHRVEDSDEFNDIRHIRRTDLFVKSMGRFEIESLVGSGPIEAFYHQKVFDRLKPNDSPMWLVVPNEAILWAGPFLADIAHYLGKLGHVILPGLDDSYLELQGRSLNSDQTAFSLPLAELTRLPTVDARKPTAEPPTLLKDIAGYGDIRARVEELIIWPERHRGLFRRTSRSSGILFFGPPGCGKSRLARAIAGELEQEVRLLSPSDLRGAYLGWGQILIREQFDWVAENDRRMLVIDELDAVARSRRAKGEMHSDEQASVNELLVQLDRVGRLGRLVVGTTNYMASLDDAVVRSGRFGRFIPVPPPTLAEATEILDYYLKALSSDVMVDHQPRVQVLTTQALSGILKSVCDQNLRESRFFCGADLEEAVNRAYLRRLRETAIRQPPGTDFTTVTVEITGKDLWESLQQVPRSVTKRAVTMFLKDVDRFCGSTLAKQLSASLFESETPST